MENNSDVASLISSYLDSGNYKEVLNVPHLDKFAKSFKDNCGDIISVIKSKISDNTILLKPSLLGACEQMLNLITEEVTPEEVLLEFIEQIEDAKNDAQFSLILNPLQKVLKKLTVKRGRTLEWCLNSISSYIEEIPIPEYNLEEKERLLLECDDNIRRIGHVYSLVETFYKAFMIEFHSEDIDTKTRQVFCAFLISLIGKPLIFIDLDPAANAQSELRHICSHIINDICSLEKNVLTFLKYVEECSRENKLSRLNNDLEEDKSPYDHREKVNMTSLSGLFYVLFSGDFEIIDTAIPQVYKHKYIVHTVLLSVNHLLSFTEYGPQMKAVTLCKSLLILYPSNVSHTALLCPVHFNLLKGLVNVAIFSIYEHIRKHATQLINTHINKFEYKGRCMLIRYILETANHSGMIGYAITLYKNSINEAFNSPAIDECFTGAQIMNMIKIICHLPHKAESDLVELADQIITSLNFLRYLVIKDTLNLTGIRDNFQYIEEEYLEKLKIGLNMSKAHFEAKSRELDEDKTTSTDATDISINVSGNMLDSIPLEKKKEIVHSSLNALHLIESLHARLSECMELAKTNVNIQK
ncbi:glomulin-like isoform X1 [Battus philenor]|uniref:glomulin-like isoform X1 n=1 Tax=Battus philenor TaxID=42288 RepID=UPI0035CF9A78